MFGIPAGVCAIPAVALKKDMVGDSSIIIMFTNYIIPMGIIAWYSVGGAYDALITRAEKRFVFCNQEEGEEKKQDHYQNAAKRYKSEDDKKDEEEKDDENAAGL